MTIKAKPILKNKFWIVEKDGERIGTLSKQEDKRYMYSCSTGTDYFTDIKAFNNYIGGLSFDKATISDGSKAVKEIHGFSKYPSTSYNVMYNVQKKLPFLLKVKKSRACMRSAITLSYFDKGWVRSFCPKLVTLEKYEYKGSFQN